MSWDDFERLLCFVILSASVNSVQPAFVEPWVYELEREYLERWPVPGERAARRAPAALVITGATSNTGTPSFNQLPDDHPLKRAFK